MADESLFERFYGMLAKLAAKRFVETEADKKAIAPNQHIQKVEVFFSDFSSQWFSIHVDQTVKSFRQTIANTIDRGESPSDFKKSSFFLYYLADENGTKKFCLIGDQLNGTTLKDISSHSKIYYLSKIRVRCCFFLPFSFLSNA